jgi:hypothetical protein
MLVFSCDFETAKDISFVDSKIHKCYIEHVKLNLTYPTPWRSSYKSVYNAGMTILSNVQCMAWFSHALATTLIDR